MTDEFEVFLNCVAIRDVWFSLHRVMIGEDLDVTDVYLVRRHPRNDEQVISPTAKELEADKAIVETVRQEKTDAEMIAKARNG
ncbi:hypothetical protein LQW54_000881 [Pestalotiopsis sp. IQ-011]